MDADSCERDCRQMGILCVINVIVCAIVAAQCDCSRSKCKNSSYLAEFWNEGIGQNVSSSKGSLKQRKSKMT